MVLISFIQLTSAIIVPNVPANEPRREPELEQPSPLSSVRGAESPSEHRRETELEQPTGWLFYRQTTVGESAAQNVAKRFRAVKSNQFRGANRLVRSQTPVSNPRIPTPEAIPVSNPRNPTPEAIDSTSESPTTAPHAPDASSSFNEIPDPYWEKMV